jgi:hypothetical protein
METAKKASIDKYNGMYQNGHGVDDCKDGYFNLVDSFYNLVTDFYEIGWGQSFHLANRFQSVLVRMALSIGHRVPHALARSPARADGGSLPWPPAPGPPCARVPAALLSPLRLPPLPRTSVLGTPSLMLLPGSPMRDAAFCLLPSCVPCVPCALLHPL